MTIITRGRRLFASVDTDDQRHSEGIGRRSLEVLQGPWYQLTESHTEVKDETFLEFLYFSSALS